jgi:hypothetical protein
LFFEEHVAPTPPGMTHTPPMHARPWAHGSVELQGLVADEGGWQVPTPAHIRFPSQSDDVVHGAPVAPRVTQLPHSAPPVVRQ